MNVFISLGDKARLYIRISDIEPEKSSPDVEGGVKPFQPRRRVEDVEEEVEMAYETEVDEVTLTPSIKAVSVLVEEEPEYDNAI